MMRSFLRPSLLLFIAGACSEDPVSPDVTNPARYVFNSSVAFRCSVWQPTRPTVTLGLFDVFFAEQGEAPTQAKIDAIKAAGGAVVHSFQLNGMRVIASPEAVSQLGADEVVGVRNTAVLTVHVGVGLSDPSAVVVFTTLGGTVEYVTNSAPHALIGSIPDASLPDLRASSRIRYVEWSGPVCSLSDR